VRRGAPVVCLLVACANKDAAPIGLYCEGGVINGNGGGGECMTISAEKPDGHVDTVGKATLQSKYMTPYTVRRDGKSKTKFFLIEGGVPVGAIVQDGDWITVTIVSSGQTLKMRSDAPGALI